MVSRSMKRAATMAAIAAMAAMLLSPLAGASVADDEKAVAALDKEYQAAVKRNDVATMDRIMHDDFLLVLGNGKSITGYDLLEEAAAGTLSYEQQDEIDGTQTVRVSGDTALVTALLWIKGEHEGQPFDRKLWFSDTYVRSGGGWQYLYGQASLPLPQESANDNEARVVEIRSYNLKPGTRDRFHRLFLEEAWPMLKRAQMDVVAYGPSLHDENSYFLMRSFPGVEARQQQEDAFYGSDEWRNGPREAILDCIESYTTVVIDLDDATIEGLRKIARR